VILFSPAKINLFLRVLSRRNDGYHNLASLFQAVDLGDTLEFSFAEEDELTCSDPQIPTDGTNLITKAIQLFGNKTGLRQGIKVHLNKKVPAQAGLGGGSSNAATTLYALNSLHKTNVSDQTLGQWAGEIGSDISFFFSHGRAFCTGRGEQVQDVEPTDGPAETLWLIKPKEGLPTPLIFKFLKLDECSSEDPMVLLQKNSKGIYFLNDLEKPAFQALPSLQTLKNELLSQGLSAVSLTGSGTGLLALGKNTPKVSSDHRCYQLKYLSRLQNEWYRQDVRDNHTTSSP
jgi:4-diphosphocytidyl-2-C-methyl-D-erythritol kinase